MESPKIKMAATFNRHFQKKMTTKFDVVGAEEHIALDCTKYEFQGSTEMATTPQFLNI